MIYIGVDPGVSGGISWMQNVDGHSITKACAMPDTLHDLSLRIRGIVLDSTNAKAIIERVAPMPGEGVRSVFTFGRNVGQIEAMLAAHTIPFEYVNPQEWQAVFGLVFKRKGGIAISRTDKKNKHKAVAQQLFPHITVTHAIADALLIAEFCRRKEKPVERA